MQSILPDFDEISAAAARDIENKVRDLDLRLTRQIFKEMRAIQENNDSPVYYVLPTLGITFGEFSIATVVNRSRSIIKTKIVEICK